MTHKQPIKARAFDAGLSWHSALRGSKHVALAGVIAGSLAMQPAFAQLQEVMIDNFDNDPMAIDLRVNVDGVGNTEVLPGSTGVTGIIGGQRIGSAIILDGPPDVPRGVDTDWGLGSWSTSIGDTISGRTSTVWDGDGQNSTAYPNGDCQNAGLDVDWTTATAVTIFQTTGDLNGIIRLKISSWDGANTTEHEEEMGTGAGAQTYVFDPSGFAAAGVDLGSVCRVALQIQSSTDQSGNFTPLDTGLDRITVTLETPEVSCTSQSFGGNVTSAGEGVDVEKTFTMTAANLPSAGCPNLVVSETVTCTGLDLAITEAPAGCTLSGGPDTYTITCAGGLTNGSNPFTFLTQYTGDNGSCTVAMQSATCDGTPATISPACSASISRVPPPPAVPAIAPIGLAAALIGLPLAGVFFARRRRRS